MTNSRLIKKCANLNGFAGIDTKFITMRGKEALLISGHPDKRRALRCPKCGRICPGYDTKSASRRWRTLDWGTVMVFIESPSHRVCCPEHGVITAEVPWARHNSRFTRDFEDTVAVKALEMSKKALSTEMRIDWHTVGDIVTRVANEKLPAEEELFEDLKVIGVDETSFKKGHKYITLVVNHETAEVVFAQPGHDKETFNRFFEKLTQEQLSNIQIVSGDGARWIKSCMKEHIPWAVFCLDRFHVVQWSLEAIDKVRRSYWRIELNKKKKEPKRTRGRPKAGDMKESQADPTFFSKSKYALGKNPDHLTEFQKQRIEEIHKLYPRLFRAYQLKESLRNVFSSSPETIEENLKNWLSWASRCRIPEFVELGRKIRRHRDGIIATVQHKVSNARIESINNKIKCLIRRSYGFRNTDNMISLIKLGTSRVKLDYPGR